MSTEKITLVIPEESAGERIDSFLASSLEADLSRSFLQKLIRSGSVTVNGLNEKPNYRLRADDRLEVAIPEPEKLDVEARDIPLDIIFEDADLAVINKQPGITVHPGAGTHGDTLVSALMFHLEELSSIGGVERPGIVHRLDKDTAGLMVIAKTDHAHRNLSEQFARRTTQKEYIAVVHGIPLWEHRLVERPIGRHPVYRHKMTVRDDGRTAISELFCEQSYRCKKGNFSQLRVVIHTGRTHQIRVHCSAEGFPIVGDPLYSKNSVKTALPHLLLASILLAFDHPSTGERLTFTIPAHPHIREFIATLHDDEDGIYPAAIHRNSVDK
jgi:23S rRNA pseudouridine1911/1915/1917 synthase